jgi:hypothetical protein
MTRTVDPAVAWRSCSDKVDGPSGRWNVDRKSWQAPSDGSDAQYSATTCRHISDIGSSMHAVVTQGALSATSKRHPEASTNKSST